MSEDPHAPAPAGAAEATGGTASGLAWRILETGYRFNIPRVFAALLLISLVGIAIFVVLGWLQRAILRRWHESAVAREGRGDSRLNVHFRRASQSAPRPAISGASSKSIRSRFTNCVRIVMGETLKCSAMSFCVSSE